MNVFSTRCRSTAIPVVAFFILICWSSLAAADYTITPTSRNFGIVGIGLVSNAAAFNVVNTGATPITITSYTLAPSQFQFFGGWAPKTLQPGEAAVFDLKFAPTLAIPYSGTFTIFVDNVPTVINLSGSGKVSGAVSTLSVSSIDFGSVAVGQNSAPQKISVTNTGTGPMNVSSILVGPPFSIIGFTRAGTLKPGAKLPLQVTFRPTTVGPAKQVMVFTYDSVPINGIAVSGTGTAATALAISSSPTLPLGTTRSAYLSTLLATGGMPPYTFALSSGSSLPVGLTLSSAGTISGTLDPSVGIGSYIFTVQVSDSTSAQSTLPMTLSVLGPTGSNCNNITWFAGQTHLPGIPLNDLGAGTYLGSQGGLYPDGSNVRPAIHDADGVAIATGIQPLDADGIVDPVNGKIGILSIGMSDTFDVFFTLMTNAMADPTVSRSLAFVPGAQPRASAAMFADPNSPVWNPIMQNFLPQSGVTANQVLVAWVNDGNPTTGNFPANMRQTQANLEAIVQNLYLKFPNIKLAYFGSRFYAGYSNGTLNPANPEPFAYQNGFAVKWTVQDQLNGLPSLNYNPLNGPVTAPWIDWGLYDWANGMLARSDGMVWTCQDLQNDGTHPSNPQGREKDANMLLNFFKSDDTTTPWFLAH